MTPDGWQQTLLADAADLIMGQAPSSTVVRAELGYGMPFIQGNAEFGARFPAPIKSCSSPLKIAEPGDLLISVRAPVGALNRAHIQLAIGRGLAAIRAKTLYSGFAWYALQHCVYDLSRLSQGSTFEAISRDALGSLILPRPPFGEQRKIAAILSSVDDAIEATQAVIDQLQVVKKAMMAELLTRGLPGRHTRFKQTEIGEVPEDWDLCTIREACTKVTDGTHDTPKPTAEGIPFITAQHIRDGFIAFSRCFHLPEEIHRSIFARCNPAVGDVLLVNIGAGTATPALVRVDFEFSLKNVALLKPRHDLIVGAFLEAWLSHHRPRIVGRVTQGGAQPYLSLRMIGELPMALPPLDEQRQISMMLEEVQLAGGANVTCRETLERAKSALMSVLLTGEVRVTPDEAVRD